MAGSGIVTRLREGMPPEQMLSPFERLALPAWIVILVGYAAIGATLTLTSFEIRSALGLPVATACLIIPALGMLARRYGMAAASDFLQASGVLALLSLLIQIGCILITPIAIGWADDTLVAADRMLGFPWTWVFGWFQDRPDALDHNRILYRLLIVQPPMVALILVLLRERTRLWTFVNAWAIALVITLALYPFFVARGPFWLFHIQPGDLPGLTSGLPWKFPATIEHLRDGSLRVIDRELGLGLVSFPSFHAGGAALIAWAMWSRPILRYPFLLLNIGVGGSAIVSGGHYFVDLIGGVAVAMIAAGIATALGRRLNGAGKGTDPKDGATASGR